jgi:hypothetical protein
LIRRIAGQTLIALLLASVLCLAAAPLAATQVRIFQVQSQAGFLTGTLEGVSVDSLGRMSLAPRAERLASLSEPFLLSAAALPDGWVVGTGNAGRVLKIDRNGQVTELFAAPEPEVFAIWADPDGTVYAGTSPRGKVYRIAAGKTEVFFDPGETYIWALARAADGGLLVATGTQGKLFKVPANGKGTMLYDSEDGHLRALEVLPDGDVLIGTAGEGLILRLGKDGNARTLYDADEPEVVALASAPDGTCYAAVVASESSLVDLSQAAAPAAPGEPQVTVTAEAGAAEPAATGTRRPGDMGPRSQILSLSKDGMAEILWGFPDDTVYDLLWRQGRLWVATGLEGKLYSWADRQMLLEKDVDERQIVALLPGEAGPAFATTNAAAFFRITAESEKTGTYTSAAMDTGQASRFGTFRWRGETPGSSAIRFSFRSGVSSEPDRTWSPWTAVKGGEEIALEGLPRGRYVQWRAELVSGGGADGASPRLYNAELSYRQENLRPRIDSLGVLEPGQILVPSNFNPSNQVYEPAHPTREGIFSSVGKPADEDDAGRTKPLWKKGYRTLRWTAADPNQDGLVYDLSFRLADSTENAEWLKVVDELEETYFSFDATALPDGVYRFRLRASDRPANDPGSALEAERVSDPVVIDHTTPVLVKVDRAGGRVRATVRDSANPLREAMVSVDAEEWKPVPAADGLIDGQTETLVVDPSKPGGLLLLRIMDAAYNVVTFNLSEAR